MTIQRWDSDRDGENYSCDDGDFVLYTDHLADLKAKDDAHLTAMQRERECREKLVEALEAAREWMIEEGCDCGVDEPESCALCLTVAALAAAKEIE